MKLSSDFVDILPKLKELMVAGRMIQNSSTSELRGDERRAVAEVLREAATGLLRAASKVQPFESLESTFDRLMADVERNQR